MGLGDLVRKKAAKWAIDDAFHQAEMTRAPDQDTMKIRFSSLGRDYQLSLNCNTYMLSAADRGGPVREGMFEMTPYFSIPLELRDAFESEVASRHGSVQRSVCLLEYDGARRERQYLHAA